MRFPWRRRRGRSSAWVFIVGLILTVSLISGLPYLVASEDAQRPPREALPVTLDLPPGVALADLEEGRVYDVIDGDTIEVVIGDRLIPVRYFGVDTPERGDRCYREATDRNTTLIGETVLLLRDERTQDRFDRELRYVFLPNGVSVDATLVAEGYGRAWRDDGQYREEIIDLETEAEAANRGCLWE